MSNLYFIRHAESEANKKRILASRLPFSLTEDGRNDADLIASELKEKIALDRIISSPLLRAVQTAGAFGSLFGIDIETDDRLTEHHLGDFSGMNYDEVKNLEGYENETLKRWSWFPKGGGESYSDVAGRIKSFFYSIEDLPSEANILIVTHAVALRLIEAVLKNTLPEYPAAFPNNGEIRSVRFTKVGEVHDIESIMLGNSSSFNHNP